MSLKIHHTNNVVRVSETFWVQNKEWDFLDVLLLQIIYSWGVVNDANCDFVHVADTG